MKRSSLLLIIVLILVLSSGMVGCGGGDQEEEAAPISTITPTQPKTTPATEPPNTQPTSNQNQPTSTTKAPATPTTTKPTATTVTIESTIGEIMDAPGGEAVLRECLGDEIVDNPQISTVLGKNLPAIAPMSGGVIIDEMVACVDQGLQALASDTSVPASTPKPTPVSEPCDLGIGGREIALSEAQLLEHGLLKVEGSRFSGWSDGTLGVLKEGSDYVFFGARSGPLLEMTTVAKTVGTLDNPVAKSVNLGTVIQNMKNEYTYAAGGPVYRDPETGNLLLFYHAEKRFGNLGHQFWALLGMAKSTDGGNTWYDLGEIYTPEYEYSEGPEALGFDSGSGPYLIIHDDDDDKDYFYVYGDDRRSDGKIVGLTVARAPVEAVVEAANAGTVTEWFKYHNGEWNEPGLGGRASCIEDDGNKTPGELQYRWVDIAYSEYLDMYVAALSAVSPRGRDAVYLMFSPDGLNDWSERILIAEEDGIQHYTTIVGTGDDPKVLGGQFYVYYPVGNMLTLKGFLARRLVSCEPGVRIHTVLSAELGGTNDVVVRLTERSGMPIADATVDLSLKAIDGSSNIISGERVMFAPAEVSGTVKTDEQGAFHFNFDDLGSSLLALEAFYNGDNTHWSSLLQETLTTTVTIDSTIGEIMDFPGGEAVLRECLGDENVDNPNFPVAFSRTLEEVVLLSGGVITDDMVACVNQRLQTLASGIPISTSTTPTPTATPEPTSTPSPTLIDLSFENSPIDLRGINATFARDVPYGPYEDNVFDIFLANSAEPTPLVIYIHGGGFIMGDKSDIYQSSSQILECLSKGVSFANINYRLLEDGDQEGMIKCLSDCQRCLQFLRYHHQQLNLHPSRVAVYGGSAGASTCLWLAFSDDMADPNAVDPVLRESTRVSAAGALAAQATMDIVKYETDVFDSLGLTLENMTNIPGVSEELLLTPYGIDSFEDLYSPALIAYRKSVDILELMSPDDPPFYVRTTDLPPQD